MTAQKLHHAVGHDLGALQMQMPSGVEGPAGLPACSHLVDAIQSAQSASKSVAELAGARLVGWPRERTSIAGTVFIARIKDTTTLAGRPAVIPTIAGQAWITSMGQYGLDPTDPYREGHIISDVWF